MVAWRVGDSIRVVCGVGGANGVAWLACSLVLPCILRNSKVYRICYCFKLLNSGLNQHIMINSNASEICKPFYDKKVVLSILLELARLLKKS